ncbi:MAG: histidine phosphatase family protein, partial [Armatimonadetes bacterium]|nr:histidine phosphatase family protein [Armatimonadota bacterium]
MRILLIRHSEPDYSRDTITEVGHRQAKALANSLEKIQIDRLFVSPLGRAQA